MKSNQFSFKQAEAAMKTFKETRKKLEEIWSVVRQYEEVFDLIASYEYIEQEIDRTPNNVAYATKK